MPNKNPEDTDRIERAEVEKAAEEEAARVAFETAGATVERPCLTNFELVRKKSKRKAHE